MYDLKKAIEANTTDDVVDYEKVMATIDNDYVNPIVAKKTDKEKLLVEAVESIVKDLGAEGVENLDGLKLYVKQMGGNTDEIKETNLKLDKEIKELTDKYDKEVESRTKLEKDNKLTTEMNLVRGLGVTDQDEVDFLHFKFGKAVSEEKDFNTVVEEYAKENGVKTSTKYVKDDFSQAKGSVDIGAVYKAQQAKNRR
jgi:hypothetical protein